MRILKRLFASLLSLSLLLSLSGGALAAGPAAGFTMGIYVTAGLSGSCYGLDPVTGEELGENYLRYCSAAALRAEQNDANLFLDLGNRPQDLSLLSQDQVEPMALCLRYGSFFLVPGAWEESLSSGSQDTLSGLLGRQAPDALRQSVEVLWAAEDRERQAVSVLEYSAGLGMDAFEVRILRLEDAARWEEESGEDQGDLVIAVAPSGRWTAEALSGLAAGTRAVDLILVGAGQEAVPLAVTNAAGEKVPVAGGKGATEVKLTVSRSGELSFGRGSALKLAEYPNDPELEELLLPYYEAAVEQAGQELGTLSGDWDQISDLVHYQSDTMDLLHESRLWASGAELSILSPQASQGSCLGQLLDRQRSAPLTLRDCRALCPDRQDTLYVVGLTGSQLKDWLEECVKDRSAVWDQVYGVSYDAYLGNPEGQRVLNMTFEGRPITADQMFRAAVSASRLTGEGPWQSITGISPDSPRVLWDAASSEQFAAVGGSCTWILVEYIRSLSAAKREITPPQARSHWSLSPSTSEEALAQITRLDFVHQLYEAAGRPSAYLDLKQTFSDLAGEDPAAAWAVQAGIVLGNGSGQFLPDTLVTREQAVVMLLRYDNARGAGPEGSWAVAVPYTDAANTSVWAAQALMWNAIRGYLPPDDGGNFDPQATLTAAELEFAIGQLGK